MPLFKCSECGCVENTATSNYWTAKADKEPILCSECDPTIARWHGRFEKKSAAGMLADARGFISGENASEGDDGEGA